MKLWLIEKSKRSPKYGIPHNPPEDHILVQRIVGELPPNILNELMEDDPRGGYQPACVQAPNQIWYHDKLGTKITLLYLDTNTIVEMLEQAEDDELDLTKDPLYVSPEFDDIWSDPDEIAEFDD